MREQDAALLLVVARSVGQADAGDSRHDVTRCRWTGLVKRDGKAEALRDIDLDIDRVRPWASWVLTRAGKSPKISLLCW